MRASHSIARSAMKPERLADLPNHPVDQRHVLLRQVVEPVSGFQYALYFSEYETGKNRDRTYAITATLSSLGDWNCSREENLLIQIGLSLHARIRFVW